jgi:DNA repair exonuclease SbcCD ATPase subunit
VKRGITVSDEFKPSEHKEDEIFAEEINNITFSDDDTSDSKSYRMSKKVIAYFKEIMEEKNLSPKEFFNTVATEIQKNNILEHASGISNEMRRHFDSDVRRLREATDSIMFIFMSQMKNILVEKDNWLQEKDNILDRVKLLEGNLKNSESTIQALNDELQIKTTEYIDLQTDFKDKIADKESIISEKNERINDKESRITLLDDELQKLKTSFAEEKNDLNNRIVQLHDEIKQFEPIKEEKGKLEKEVNVHKDNTEKLKERLEYYKDKHQSEINNLIAKQELEIKSAMIDTEIRVRNESNAALEEYREENKKLYERIDKLREEISTLVRDGKTSPLDENEEKTGK